jgi:hypothetical protein
VSDGGTLCSVSSRARHNSVHHPHTHTAPLSHFSLPHSLTPSLPHSLPVEMLLRAMKLVRMLQPRPDLTKPLLVTIGAPLPHSLTPSLPHPIIPHHTTPHHTIHHLTPELTPHITHSLTHSHAERLFICLMGNLIACAPVLVCREFPLRREGQVSEGVHVVLILFVYCNMKLLPCSVVDCSVVDCSVVDCSVVDCSASVAVAVWHA